MNDSKFNNNVILISQENNYNDICEVKQKSYDYQTFTSN